MKQEPKVLLIYPPNQLNSFEQPRPDGSLGPLYLAAALDLAEIANDVLDASIGSEEDTLEDTFYKQVMQPNGLVRVGMSNERIKEYIAKGQYNVVAIHSNFTPQTRMALEVARLTKEINPEILVITGGVNARSMPERFLQNGLVDAICMSEGEEIVVKMLRAWAGGLEWEKVNGISFWRDGRVIKNLIAPEDIAVDLDVLPIPAWHKLSFERYARISSPHADSVFAGGDFYAPIMTSRGCPFKCLYCHISKEKEPGVSGDIGRLRLKSVDRVLEEIRILKSLGVRKVYIEDDSLLARKARVKEIFGRLLGAGLEIANVNGVNLVHFLKRNSRTGKLETDRDYLELLHASGFRTITFPVESGSQRVLDKYATGKLHLDTMDIVAMVKIASDIGIACLGNMMIGFPDESEKEIMKSVAYAKRVVDAGARYCSFFIPIPFPGSHLYDYAIANGHLSPKFDPDSMNWHRPVMQNTRVAPDRILELREWAWRTANQKEYVEERLKKNIGNRWNSSAPPQE